MSILVDSALTFSEALGKVSANCPPEILHALILKEVEYYSFDEKLHRGQLVINKSVEKDVEEIFELIRKIKFPIAQAIPISQYQNDDLQSMEANNTSAFNYRMILNTNQLSQHAYGIALDINPRENPYLSEGVWYPANAKYNPEVIGTLLDEGEIVRKFKELGWIWGGDWEEKDYQHFSKKI